MVACGQPYATTSKASPSSSRSPIVSARQSPAAATPGSALPSCRLPVTWSALNTSTREWSPRQAGFMELPAGNLTEDTVGTAIVRVSDQGFYDLAVHKWLPVPREAISPDGLQYAFVDSGTGLHVVAARTGTVRVLFSDGGWVVLEFGRDAIYLAKLEPLANKGDGAA